MAQPATATHCEDCNACIDELDHHCPWMGKCIGKGNIAYFRRFNVCWMSYSLFVILALAVQSGTDSDDDE